jgi:hypothetical protein
MIKAQRFWSKFLRTKVASANKALKSKNFLILEEILEDIIELLKDQEAHWKDRVAICFILEQMALIDPLTENIIDALNDVLKTETDVHVKEFAVWALGKIVEESQSLTLIKETIPTIVKFLNDDSEQVKAFASELHERLNEFLKERSEIDDQIKGCAVELTNLINERLLDMKNRSDDISRDALGLDYQAANDRREEMNERIRVFNETNQEQEDEILAKEKILVDKIKAFRGESREIIKNWRIKRGEKEDLIRRVECILRIQSKIYGIISFIVSKTPDNEIKLDEITELTKQTGRPYSEKEVVEILQQLVDEDIVPTFMIEQIKDYQLKAKNYLKNENEEENDE